MKIYTKLGDSGTSILLKSPNERISKTSAIFHALGDNDELSSLIGLARYHCEKHPEILGELSASLLQIQKDLQNLNSHLAAPRRSFPTSQATAALEAQIDALTAQMPQLKEFLLPGGSEAAAVLHVARSVCRRAERSFFAARTEAGQVEGAQFMNRLSDFLFTAARYVNFKLSIPDIPFK